MNEAPCFEEIKTAAEQGVAIVAIAAMYGWFINIEC